MASEDLEEAIKVQAGWCRKGKAPHTLRCMYYNDDFGCTHDDQSDIPNSTDCRYVIHVKRIDYLNWKLTGRGD